MSAKRYMLDTNTVSFMLRDRSHTMQKQLIDIGIGNVCISAITEGELRYGLWQRPEAIQLGELVDSFLSRVDSLPWDTDAARSYGELRRHSTIRGITLQSMDMLIGAHAIAVGSTLITNDKAFSHLSEWIALDDWTVG